LNKRRLLSAPEGKKQAGRKDGDTKFVVQRRRRRSALDGNGSSDDEESKSFKARNL